jgi:hypothetical protein
MADKQLIRHGTDAGYRAELKVGTPCERCKNAHRVYATQFGAKAKREGTKYGTNEVIDHLYKSGRKSNLSGVAKSAAPSRPGVIPAETHGETLSEPGDTRPESSLGDRLSERIRGLVVGGNADNPEYVTEDDTGYVHEIEDIDPLGPEWQPVEDAEFIINAQGLAKIQENLGTYLSIVGMTVEMIDPFCGPVLAQNFDNIVSHWSKVIAHYPKAANLFLDGTGGIIFTWIGALQATWPFLYAIYQHHLARTITIGPDGRIYRKGEQPNPMNNGQVIDPLQPQFQYSAT